MSPPLRRRGSKQALRAWLDSARVASLAEAWIETDEPVDASSRLAVASLAEAWIETTPTPATAVARAVASLAEAWIETCAAGDR